MKRIVLIAIVVWLVVPYLVPDQYKRSASAWWLMIHPASLVHSQTTFCASRLRNGPVGIAGYSGSDAEARKSEARRCLALGHFIPSTNPDQAYTHRFEHASLMLADGDVEQASDIFFELARGLQPEFDSHLRDRAWLAVFRTQSARRDPAAAYDAGREALSDYESDEFRYDQIDGRIAGLAEFAVDEGVTENPEIWARRDLEQEFEARVNGLRFEVADLAIAAGEAADARAILDRAAAFEFYRAAHNVRRDRTLAWLEMELSQLEDNLPAMRRAYDRWAELDSRRVGPVEIGYFHFDISRGAQIMALDWQARCDEVDVMLEQISEAAAEPGWNGEDVVWQYNRAQVDCDVAGLRGNEVAANRLCAQRDALYEAAAESLGEEAWILGPYDAPRQNALSCFRSGNE